MGGSSILKSALTVGGFTPGGGLEYWILGLP